jgi:hypothetical protein
MQLVKENEKEVCIDELGSAAWTRTTNPPVNSRPLYH